MNKKNMIIIALSCLLSLGIGVFIGYGINVQNLSGTAFSEEELFLFNTLKGDIRRDIGELDIETAMMAVQLDRANQLDTQLNAQMDTIKELNEKITEANSIISEMRALRPRSEKETTKITEQIVTLCTKYGIQIMGNADTLLKQKEWDQNIELVKQYIDSLNDEQQMNMIRLQSLSDKRNEAYEIITNFIQKMAKTRDSITGNMR